VLVLKESMQCAPQAARSAPPAARRGAAPPAPGPGACAVPGRREERAGRSLTYAMSRPAGGAQGVETVVEDLLHGDPEWHRLAALPGLQEGWAELKVKAAVAIAECQARAPAAPHARRLTCKRGRSPAASAQPCALVNRGGSGGATVARRHRLTWARRGVRA